MPPKKAPRPNVAELPSEEKISYLVQQHENFADWRIGVDEKLEKVDALDGKVDALDSKVAQLSAEVRDTGLGIREILLFLKGQQTPGLERPGLHDDFKLHASDIAELKNRLSAYDKLRARVGYTIAGFTGMGAASVWKWWPFVSKLFTLLNAR